MHLVSPLVRDDEAPLSRAVGASVTKKQAPSFGHRDLKAHLPNVDVRHVRCVALLA